MRISRMLACVVGLFVTAGATADAPGTMRVDYFHSGNSATEMFSLDQVVIEPLPWAGNMHQPIDTTLLVAKLQQHLRRMGNDRRGQGDQPQLP